MKDRRLHLIAALGALALGGACFSETDATGASLPDLRGFGRVKVESFNNGTHGNPVNPVNPVKQNGVSVMRFECESPEKAETVAGKFLMDLYAEDGVAFKDGIHETKGGAAFAVERDGRTTVIYAAESREALEGCLTQSSPSSRSYDETLRTSRTSRESKRIIASAAVPEWMKAFGWGVYGMGGLENHHQWMNKAKQFAGIDPKADKSRLDPRDDFEFLREMGPMFFDNWLQYTGMDMSDAIVDPGVFWREKLAQDHGIPYGFRFYLPIGDTGGGSWFTRRFAAHTEKPATWMQSGWLRYHLHQPHASWHDEDVWGYSAARAKDLMTRFGASGKVRNWMIPCGELLHQPWYDWHADYSVAASNSWHGYLRGKGVGLDEAAAMFNRPERPFRSWDEVPVPEFAHFAGLSGMVMDLAGTWLTRDVSHKEQEKQESSDWRELPDFPGSWDFLSLYGGAQNAQKVKNTAERRFRRVFKWDGRSAVKDGKRIYLYFFPMGDKGGTPPRHEVSFNGGKAATVSNWCALDVTDRLREGENTLDILLRGIFWNGRIFLSSEKPEMYPNMSEARCRLWTLWHDWRRDAKIARVEMLLDAMRQADPNAPFEFMAPAGLGMRDINRLFRDYGCFSHFTGEGIWFFPWYKRYAKLYGYQGTSELAGPYDTVAKARASSLRVFLAGLDMHKPVFLTQTYSRNPEVRAWWLAHKGLFSRMGKYDIDLKQPQILIYRRMELVGAPFPAPFPAVDESVKAIRSPWNYDLGRGSLQSIGQSFLYIDDDGIEDGKMDGFKVMIDCGNEIIPEEHVARIRAWVEKGGVFIAYPFTGRSTPLKAGTWPMAALTGTRALPVGRRVGISPDGALLPPGEAKRRQYGDDMALEPVSDDVKVLVRYADGRAAVAARRVGKGMVVHIGSFYWRGSEDVQGMWNPQDEVERAFLRDLFAACGQPKALVETDDRLVLAQPYRSKNGLDLVAVLCNFNEEGEELSAKRETVVRLRCGRKPRRIVGYAGVNLFSHKEQEKQENSSTFQPFNFSTFEWDDADGVATVKVALPPQEVAILNAECYGVGDALAHWWTESKEQWRELKKPTRDFSKYYSGEWKDPTQDLKEGWNVDNVANVEILPITNSNFQCKNFSTFQPFNLSTVPLDCLQFWGWPEGKGAVCRKTFDLDDAGWLTDGGTTRLVVGSWGGSANFLSPATVRLNGTILAGSTMKGFLDFDVGRMLKTSGNVLEVELADGEKFTGMYGNIFLYHRGKPFASIWIKGGNEPLDASHVSCRVSNVKDVPDHIKLHVPAKWQGRFRVRLYMEGARDVPKGVRVRDRFVRKHHHNLGAITDIDITGLLRFGEENRIDIGANSPGELPDKTSIKPLSILRIDLYKEAK